MSDDLIVWLRQQLDADEYLFNHWPVPGTQVASNGVLVASWDARRGLAEVAAKRRIIDLHAQDGAHECPACDAIETYTGLEVDCLTLHLLALPYADRSGYREEWRP